jgi:hypothetical protein
MFCTLDPWRALPTSSVQKLRAHPSGGLAALPLRSCPPTEGAGVRVIRDRVLSGAIAGAGVLLAAPGVWMEAQALSPQEDGGPLAMDRQLRSIWGRLSFEGAGQPIEVLLDNTATRLLYGGLLLLAVVAVGAWLVVPGLLGQLAGLLAVTALSAFLWTSLVRLMGETWDTQGVGPGVGWSLQLGGWLSVIAGIVLLVAVAVMVAQLLRSTHPERVVHHPASPPDSGGPP